MDDINYYVNTLHNDELSRTVISIDLPILDRPYYLDILHYFLNVDSVSHIFEDDHLKILHQKSNIKINEMLQLERLAFDINMREIEKFDDGFNEVGITAEVIQHQYDTHLILRTYYKI